MECILRKFGNYENFEEVTGGSILPKSRVWAAARKYLQKENCVGEVVVCLSEELLSQAVMMVESCRPTLTINLSGARQHWLEGMFRHEIGTHYLRGVNNNLQPWSTSAGRKQYGLKPANPTEEGLASLHSVLLRKQPYLWRAALLYYTVYHAARMSFSQLFSHIAQFVQDPAVRWEYCLRAKRGQTDTSQPASPWDSCTRRRRTRTAFYTWRTAERTPSVSRPTFIIIIISLTYDRIQHLATPTPHPWEKPWETPREMK
ncbi:uncharacterized protein KIAA0895-like [Coregonus clupeaformis]|uniref:uncharacterized protein KIAA0895-like n=1 Tax=Coregonus clupeaformis TaxID=59861 RepID=UPI001E1C329C|nr:uncharacterized protein KIAA0895-like [Coregonus clupeaformis]